MACGLVLRVYLLAAVASAVTGISDDASIVRRHKTNDAAAHLEPNGKVQMIKISHQEAPANAAGLKPPGEVSYCDQSYPMGTANSNTCPDGGISIIRQEDCRHAATVLGLEVAQATNSTLADFWLKNEDNVEPEWTPNPSKFPKNCFLDTEKNKVFFNPTGSVQADDFVGWEGTPICEKIIYKNANASEVDSKSATGCIGDYEPLETYAECNWAHDCQWGNMYCQTEEMANNAYSTVDAPSGCYRDHLGCYGFNNGAGTGDLSGKTAVCRLKGHTFDAAQAAAGAAGKLAGDSGATAAAGLHTDTGTETETETTAAP